MRMRTGVRAGHANEACEDGACVNGARVNVACGRGVWDGARVQFARGEGEARLDAAVLARSPWPRVTLHGEQLKADEFLFWALPPPAAPVCDFVLGLRDLLTRGDHEPLGARRMGRHLA